MNYTVYKALNTLSNATASNLANCNVTFNTTLGAIGAAILNVDANYSNSTTNTLLQLEGGHSGWTNNITTLGDGPWATAYGAQANNTTIAVTQVSTWKYVSANIAIPS